MFQYKYPQARLIIFAKAPIAGYCKTRLIPQLGEQGAAQLQQELITDCLTQLCCKLICPTELWCSPDSQHPFFTQIASQFKLSLHSQQGADLGEKMYHAMAQGDAAFTLIVGTDCPPISTEYVESAIACLQAGQDAVIGPAEDGGYILLGLRQVTEPLFQGISWGTEHVFAQTTQKFDASGHHWRALETLWDLDDAQDYSRYQQLKIAHVRACK